MAGLMGYSGSTFELLASEYDAWFEEEGKLIFDIEVSAFKEVLSLLPKPWLEVGVGSGRFAQALGIETGIDPSTKLLEMAKERGISVFRARGEDGVFHKETFGTVFLIVTLCFVDSPIAVLQEVHRILKSKGKVVLGLVLRGSPWGKFYQAKKTEGHRFYKWATFYSYQEVERLLTDSGFTVEKVVSTLFQKPVEVEKTEATREGLFVRAGFTVIVAGKVQKLV
jgi:SAM-dependent methyltransferase